jgi:tRNA threonylcarbamoyladenosine biosynthesis protein TsaE
MRTPLQTFELDLADELATDTLGQELAHIAADLQSNAAGSSIPGRDAGGRIHLKGELGAGKTSLVRSFLRECGVTGRIKSPSYALLESYAVSNLYLYHLDFYRFSDPSEWLDAGFRDILRENALVLIEWPERAADLLNDPDMFIELTYLPAGRHAKLSALTEKGLKWLTALTLKRAKFQPN